MSAGPRDEDDEREADEPADAGGDGDRSGAANRAELVDLRERLDALRRDLESFEDDVAERTVHREAVESDLRRYVRYQVGRGHARGWGPYLVLLYGTAMTVGAFYLLSGGWAILAMFVIWLSTLGLYALMLIVGAVLGVASLPGRAAELIRNRGR
jgi:Flp pilus assembly protein TadB